ncbi:MAG: ABC transporter permease [Verrucomicrobiota bacterium]
MNLEAVEALVLRQLFLYLRNGIRFVELFFWPTVQLLVWGFLTAYLKSVGGEAMPWPITYLIGALILWDALFRSQQGVAISFLEDVWSRNLLNVFVAPVRTREYLAAACVVGFFRILATGTLLAVMAILFYAFNVFDMGLALIPFYVNLMAFGWGLGMISTALILRFGQAAEGLAWAVPFLIQPFAAVFYPVSALPGWLEPVALALPCAHVFEGMRDVLAGEGFPAAHLLWATGLNVLFLGGAIGLFGRMLGVARKRGLLTRFASQ